MISPGNRRRFRAKCDCILETGHTRAWWFQSISQSAAEFTTKRAWERPFSGRPDTLSRLHRVRPELQACVGFAEWTSDGKLRAPVVLQAVKPATPHGGGGAACSAPVCRAALRRGSLDLGSNAAWH
jgi:hypothetical protein